MKRFKTEGCFSEAEARIIKKHDEPCISKFKFYKGYYDNLKMSFSKYKLSDCVCEQMLQCTFAKCQSLLNFGSNQQENLKKQLLRKCYFEFSTCSTGALRFSLTVGIMGGWKEGTS